MCDNIIILLLVILLAIIFYKKFIKNEYFDKSGSEIVEYGKNKYDLRGVKIPSRNVTNCYYDKRICYDDTFGNTEQNTSTYNEIPSKI